MVIVHDMFFKWSGPTSQNSCDMSLQVKVTSKKCARKSHVAQTKIFA